MQYLIYNFCCYCMLEEDHWLETGLCVLKLNTITSRNWLPDKINKFKNISYSLARRHQALQASLSTTDLILLGISSECLLKWDQQLVSDQLNSVFCLFAWLTEGLKWQVESIFGIQNLVFVSLSQGWSSVSVTGS